MGEHDGLFKRIFGVPAHAAEMLRSVLPAAVVAALDLTRLELLPGRTLPPVMTLVVHHGPSGWTAPRSLHEMVEGLDQFPELRPFVPNLELRIEDLVFVSDEALLARPLSPVPQMALWLLRDGRDQATLLAHIAMWRAVLARVLAEFPDEGRVFLRYISLTAGPSSYEAVRHAILEHVPTAEAPLASIAEQLRQEGLQQGLQQGRQEALGALRDTLRVLLSQRFGTLDPAYSSRIDGADLQELQRLAQRVMLAKEPAEVFATH